MISGFHAYREFNGTLLYKRARDFAHSNENTARAYVEVPADDLASELAESVKCGGPQKAQFQLTFRAVLKADNFQAT